MKKLFKILFVLTLCLSLAACNTKENEEIKQNEEEVGGVVGLANPVVEYDSLEEINELIGVNLLRPNLEGITNERYSVINNKVAQYTCEVDGHEWIFRAAYSPNEDISGMYHEYNEFVAGQDGGLYVNEFYLTRFFDGDRQYTIVVMEPISEDGYLLIDEELFSNCCLELELIQKSHMDDPLVGDYQDIVSQRAIAYVERHGDEYAVGVNWSNAENEVNCWTMLNIVKEDDKLTYQGEEIGYYTYDEEGELLTSEETASNNVGYFEIKDGKLYWTGASQEECRACVFEKIIYEE